MPALKILYRSSVFAGRVVELDKPVVTLGRDPATCDVLFDEEADRVVSRQHARLVWEGATLLMEPLPGKLVLRDKVILNGPTSVRPGDVFELAGPGGPAVEVQFEAADAAVHKLVDDRFPFTNRDLRLPAALPLLSPDDAEAPTARSLKPVREESSVVVAPSAAEAVTDPESATWHPPSPEQHTMMLPALDPDAVGASTRFLRVDELQAPPATERPRPSSLAAVGAGVAVVVLLVGALVGWQAYSRAEAERRAAERVERLKEAFKNIQRPPGLSDEDWEAYALEKQAEKQTKPAAAPAARVEPVDEFVLPPEDDEEPPPPPPEETTDRRSEAQALFASLRRLELERLSLSGDRSRQANARRERIDADAVQGRATYEALVTDLLHGPGAQQQAVLTAARYLGECDATLPASLVTQALAAARSLATQGRAELEGQLARARDNRYTPTITAALGDQGLPLELFVLPLRASGFDARKVGEATAHGVPKGMWQLSPQVAARHQLAVGPQVVQATYDERDDRHRYEKETRAAAKAARALYEGPAAGSALLVLTFWGHGDAAELLAARARAGLAPTEKDPAKVSLSRLWEKNALGAHRQQAVEALATVAVTSFPKAFGLGFAPPFAHVEPENRR